MRIFKIIIINLFLTLLVVEVLLRLFWPNPYLQPSEDVFFHHPDEHFELHNIDQVYDGAPDPIYFNTTGLGYIQSSRTKGLTKGTMPGDLAIALGGSTTESVTVQEDHRWPDLLKIPTLNYGKSSLYSYHTYFDLIHILEGQKLEPKIVFVMDGVNNLSRYLYGGAEEFNINNRNKSFITTPFKRFVVKHIYLASFIKKIPFYRGLPKAYRQAVLKNQSYPVIEDKELRQWLDANRQNIKDTLTDIYGSIDAVAKRNRTRIVVLTQPYSYQDGYKPYLGNDLRWFPVLNGKRLNTGQARYIGEVFNDITVEVARKVGFDVIDTAVCFNDVDVSDLIYDGWHFTQKGSAYFAECVNRHLTANTDVITGIRGDLAKR